MNIKQTQGEINFVHKKRKNTNICTYNKCPEITSTKIKSVKLNLY